MRKGIKVIFGIVMILFSMYSSSILVYADDSVGIDATVTVPANNAEIMNICTQANASVNLTGATKILVYVNSSGKGLLKFNSKNYSSLDSDKKRLFMETALQATSKTSLNAKTKNMVYNFIAGQDTPVTNALKYLQTDANTDFLEAKKIFDPFSGVIGTILGVLCVLIFLMTGLSILIDAFYLVIPGVQAILERGDDTKKPIGVSREAYTALRDAEKDNEYRNVLGIYLKRRIGLILIMGICIGYLISGKIYDLIIYIVDVFS